MYSIIGFHKYHIYVAMFQSRCFGCLSHDLFPQIPNIRRHVLDLDALIVYFAIYSLKYQICITMFRFDTLIVFISRLVPQIPDLGRCIIPMCTI